MLSEINKDFYCSAGLYKDGDCEIALNGCYTCKTDCPNYHRKHPTPKQFKKEYGYAYPEDYAVYVADLDQGDNPIWVTTDYWLAKNRGFGKQSIVCACTPWGKPNESGADNRIFG